jgi:hypothetical protein
MSSVNAPNYNIDLTVRVFDEFYGYEQFVDSNEWDAVFSYFKSIYTTVSAASNFATAVFRVANEQSIPALTLLQQLQTTDSGAELNLTLAYYLNNQRSNSTLLGVSQPVQPNYYAARNVKA